MSSSAFITWQKAVGGRLKSDLRFSNTIVWNTFPVPFPSPALRSSVAAAGIKVELARANLVGLSLADMYTAGQLPKELHSAHEELDVVVDELIGVPSAADRIAREHALFALYAKLHAAG